jgi:hypothetical protein
VSVLVPITQMGFVVTAAAGCSSCGSRSRGLACALAALGCLAEAEKLHRKARAGFL